MNVERKYINQSTAVAAVLGAAFPVAMAYFENFQLFKVYALLWIVGAGIVGLLWGLFASVLIKDENIKQIEYVVMGGVGGLVGVILGMVLTVIFLAL